jgi:nucleoside-diphosphate-sugar epimerase
MTAIAITGASGYIGRNLVAELVRIGGMRIKVLSRPRQRDLRMGTLHPAVEIVEGDLCEPESLRGFFEFGCTAVNLVYLWNAGETANLDATGNLLAACRAANIRRLIHCSTAAVVGRAPDDVITENTACLPITEYAITKLKVENAVREAATGSFDSVILRPTSVFGPGGEPLKKLARDLTHGSRLRNYLKSSLFGARRMNLVHVSNVVAAIIFLAERAENFDGDTFIVSDDDSPSNNFAHVERFLMHALGVADYTVPRVPVPLGVLGWILKTLGRNNINPRCDYVMDNLTALGFRRPVEFESGLAEFVDRYRSSGSGTRA